jgi:putative membrane-bound dehydrogenase-like protein
MRYLTLIVLLSSLAAASALVLEQDRAEPHKLNGHTFTLPAGFEIELVAGPPLVDRPIVADFDEQGRLYVADSSGSRDPVAKQLKERPHRILRLEDTNGDGRFDKRTVFAGRMMFPEGVMWLNGSVYVAAPPSIWKLTDTDGDGVADQRQEWFQGKTLTGCANDLHGPYAGPDGWIYWCKGAFAKQTYERPGRKPFVTRASHIFRCRPDGTGLEPVMTGGMDNPVDVVFTPGGERIFTTTFFQHPGGGKRDGLIHAVYGGVYGKDHGPVYEHPWTGPELMPVLTHMGAAAPCGLTTYTSDVFGPDYRDNLFAAQFNMQKVSRHVLTPQGATFQPHDSDFVVSSNRDFHPTDVLEDADGSLLVVDTGGWYKLCCPTSQLHKPDILGGIYRVRRTDAPRIKDPRGLKLPWARMNPTDLAQLLGDPRPAVRRRAVATLGSKGEAALAALGTVITRGQTAEARRNAVWAATRIETAGGRALVRRALNDTDAVVRHAALHSVSLHRDRDAFPRLIELLQGTPQNARAAAEALGRIGNPKSIPALLEAVGKTTDRFLQHSLTFALMEINDPKAVATGLKADNPLVRRAALVALDGMEAGGLDPAVVARELDSTQRPVREVASWIVGRHPEWGKALASTLRERLDARKLTRQEREELMGRLAVFARTSEVQDLLARRAADPKAPRETRLLALQAMAHSGLKEIPASWALGLGGALGSGDALLVKEAVSAARSLPPGRSPHPELARALLKAAEGAPLEVRLGALAAVPGGLPKVSPELFDLLTGRLNAEQPVTIRSLAAIVLTRARLSREQLLTLTKRLKEVGPMELDRLLDAFARSKDNQVGTALVAALGDAPGFSGLRADTLRQRLAKFSPAVRQQGEKLCARLQTDLVAQKATLEKLLAALKTGDIRRGQAVFNSTKAACVSCHSIGYLGGKVGPDLTRIARIRTERDLLEAVVFPSASFVRSFEPLSITTRSGKIFNGVLKKDMPDEVVLATNATEEARISRADIEDIQPSKVSIMPAGLEKLLTPQELADLVTFLKACK